MTKSLSSMPYAQAHVHITPDGYIYLISYATTAATITPDGILTIHGLYSPTTKRHIGAFMKEYCHLDYQTAKFLYENGVSLDIETGEIIEHTIQ